MKRVKEIFSQLQSTNSKLEKQRIIRENKDNEKFKDTLVFLLSPYVLTGISEKKMNKKVNPVGGFYTDWGSVEDYVIHNNTGTDENIAIVQQSINQLAWRNEELKEFYKGLITKSIKLGCDAKTVNDVIPGLIPAFDVQLGTSIEKCKIPEGAWISISRKLNGNRCVYNNGRLTSRQGKEFTGLDHILTDIKALSMDDMVFDGELVGKNEDGLSDSENFQRSTGIANSKDGDKNSLKLVIFDILPLEEFKMGKSTDTYKERKKKLISLKEVISVSNLTNIDVVEMMYEGTDHSKIWECLDRAESMDWEGCCVNLDTIYECKRMKNLIKVKKFFDTDLRCISVNTATTGKYKGTLGSITCKYKNGTVDVGSGFSDEQRDYYFNHKDDIAGKIVTVKYKEVTTNKNGGESFQFPVFVTVRQDKEVADDE